jgi:two-component system, OmpR family, response regulator RegX3
LSAGTPILLVEDDPTIADAIKYSLEREGYTVDTAADGTQALQRFRSKPPQLVLLDLMLPGMPGLDVCRLIRRESGVPILMVTAKDGEADKIVCLELGADDYITKPFSMLELISRIRANLRRASMVERSPEPSTLKVGSVEMDTESHRVWVRGNSLALPPKEFALLHTLLRGAGRLMTRDALIAEVWGRDYFGDTRTLDVHIKRLRGKIEDDPHAPRYLKTIRGLGYKFDPPQEVGAKPA